MDEDTKINSYIMDIKTKLRACYRRGYNAGKRDGYKHGKENGYQDGYVKGQDDATNSFLADDSNSCDALKPTYEDGLNEAWQAAIRISLMSDSEVEGLLGTSLGNRFNLGYCGSEIIDLLKKYDYDRITVGDVVRTDSGDVGIVIMRRADGKYTILRDDGNIHDCLPHIRLRKTGRHFDLISVFEG